MNEITAEQSAWQAGVDAGREMERQYAAVAQEPVAWQLHLPDGRVTLEKPFPAWANGGDGYAIRPLFAAPVAAQVQQPVSGADGLHAAPSAMQKLTEALQADPEYAWSWHCNLAMPIMDHAKVTHRVANIAAARLMQHLFGIDTEQHRHFDVDTPDAQPQPSGNAGELPGDALAAFDAAVATVLPRISTLEYNSQEICKQFAGEVRAALAQEQGEKHDNQD